MGIEMADFSKREIIFGVTSLESYLDLSAQDLEFGFNETRRDRILRTYVRNNFNYHLNEIYAALKVNYKQIYNKLNELQYSITLCVQNEYTDWERPPRNPLGSRDAALELLSDGHTVAPVCMIQFQLHKIFESDYINYLFFGNFKIVRVGYLHSLRGGKSYFMHFNHMSNERDFPQVKCKKIHLIFFFFS